jgi:hypothetical protein
MWIGLRLATTGTSLKIEVQPVRRDKPQSGLIVEPKGLYLFSLD